MTKTEILQEIRQLTREQLKGHEVDVYLFGSWAKGTQARTSDVDLRIDAHQPLPAGTLATLRERLEENHIPYRVEVVDLSTVAPAFREAVIREGIRWND